MKKTIKQAFVGTLAVGACSLPFQAAAYELLEEDYHKLTTDEYRECTYAAFDELGYETKLGDRVIEGVDPKTGRVHFAYATFRTGHARLTDSEQTKLCSKDANAKGCHVYGYGFGTDEQLAQSFDLVKDGCLVVYAKKKKELLRKENESHHKKDVECFLSAFKELGYNTVTNGAVVEGTHRTTGRKAFGVYPGKKVFKDDNFYNDKQNDYMIGLCAPYSFKNACANHGEYYSPHYKNESEWPATLLYRHEYNCLTR